MYYKELFEVTASTAHATECVLKEHQLCEWIIQPLRTRSRHLFGADAEIAMKNAASEAWRPRLNRCGPGPVWDDVPIALTAPHASVLTASWISNVRSLSSFAWRSDPSGAVHERAACKT